MTVCIDEAGQKDGIAKVDVSTGWRMTSFPDVGDAARIDSDRSVRDWGCGDREDVASVIADHVRCPGSGVCARVEKSGARAVAKRVVEGVVGNADGARHSQRKRHLGHLRLGVTVRAERDADAGRPGTPNESLMRPVAIRNLE